MINFNEQRRLLNLEIQLHINTLVLYNFEVVRLVGLSEDDDDFYYIFEHAKALHQPKKISHVSCALDWTPLEDVIDTTYYNNLVRVWNLNHKSQVEYL